MVVLKQYRTACTESSELLEDVSFPQRVHWFPETYARANTGLVYPPHRLADKVLDPTLLRELRETPVGKSAFILASGNAHFAGITTQPRQSKLTYHYRALPLTLTQVYAGRIAQACGATDHIVTDSSACVSSLKVLMDVRTLIEVYKFKRVVVLTVEDAVSNLVLEFFGEARASLTLQQEALGGVPSAFDAQNSGFYVGQGAALAVFEPDGAGEAVLEAAYTASEPLNNPLGQDPRGVGFVHAALGAAEFGGVPLPRLVKTHGTGTASNNIAERAALDTLLPDGYVATSFKPSIGHTMGASGLLESLLMVKALHTGKVPAIKNRTETDKVFLSHELGTNESRFLSLAAGMGNVYAAAIWRLL